MLQLVCPLLLNTWRVLLPLLLSSEDSVANYRWSTIYADWLLHLLKITLFCLFLYFDNSHDLYPVPLILSHNIWDSPQERNHIIVWLLLSSDNVFTLFVITRTWVIPYHPFPIWSLIMILSKHLFQNMLMKVFCPSMFMEVFRPIDDLKGFSEMSKPNNFLYIHF